MSDSCGACGERSKRRESLRYARLRTEFFDSFAAKLLATIRAANKRKFLPFAALEKLAKDLFLSEVYHEVVAVRPLGGKPGSFRPIALTGMRRKAQQFILRDMLLVTIGDSPFDATVHGAGGEVRLFEDIKSAIDDGFHYWASLDIRNFFPSLRPGHLEEFPLPKWMIEKLVFLPSETPIRFTDPGCGIVLSEQAILQGDGSDLPLYYPYAAEDIEAKVSMVRQGLIQGDVCAPQIARTVLGQELQRVLEKREVIYRSYLDDIVLGARSESELNASLKALTLRLKSHPAGPLDFHDPKIGHIKDGFFYLGYRVSIRKNGDFYVRPAKKRFSRLDARANGKFGESAAFTKDELRQIGRAYANNWVNAQRPWKATEASRAYVNGEVELSLNRFIHREFLDMASWWTEDDIDFDLLSDAGIEV